MLKNIRFNVLPVIVMFLCNVIVAESSLGSSACIGAVNKRSLSKFNKGFLNQRDLSTDIDKTKYLGAIVDFKFSKKVNIHSEFAHKTIHPARDGRYIFIERYAEDLTLVSIKTGDMVIVRNSEILSSRIAYQPDFKFNSYFSSIPKGTTDARVTSIRNKEELDKFFEFFKYKPKAWVTINDLDRMVFGKIERLKHNGSSVLKITDESGEIHLVNLTLSGGVNINYLSRSASIAKKKFKWQGPAEQNFVTHKSYEEIKFAIDVGLSESHQLLMSESFIAYILKHKDAVNEWSINYYEKRFDKELLYYKNTFKKLFPAFIVNPGLLLYQRRFVRFWTKNSKALKKKSALEIINRFSEYLGSIRLYRGMLLSENQLETVLREGISANLLRSPRSSTILSQIYSEEKALMEATFPRTFNQTFVQRYGSYFSYHDAANDDLIVDENLQVMIPASLTYEVAESIGFHSQNKYHWSDLKEANLKFYVFELNTPKLSTFSLEPLIKDLFVTNGGTFSIDNYGDFKAGDKKLETLILFNIQPKDIVEAWEVMERPPNYYRPF